MRAAALAVLASCSASCSFSPAGAPNVPDDEPPLPDADVVDAPDGGPPDAPPDGPPAAACPADFAPIDDGQSGSKYKIYGWARGPSNQSRTFAAARQLCADQGAFLAFPVDRDELAALREAIPRDPDRPWHWLGLTDAGTEGTWMTVLGMPAPYLRWGSGEPDGGTAANCLVAHEERMYDSNCQSPQPFACECTD